MIKEGRGFSIGNIYEVFDHHRHGNYLIDDDGMANYIYDEQDFLDEYFVEYSKSEIKIKINSNDDAIRQVEEMSYTLGDIKLYVTKEIIFGFNDDIGVGDLDNLIKLLTVIKSELEQFE